MPRRKVHGRTSHTPPERGLLSPIQGGSLNLVPLSSVSCPRRPTSRSSVETSSTHARTWEAPGRSWGSAWSPGLTTFALAVCPMGCSHSWFRVQNSQRLRCMGEALAGMPVHSGPSHLSRPICQGLRTQAHCCQAGPNTTSWATRSESQGGILTPS